MDRRKFARSKESKSGTLMDALKGKLSIDAVSDIGGRRGRGYESLVAPKGKAGSSLEDLVDAGELDGFGLWHRAIAQLIRERGEGVE
jgi:hypothetical protein